MKKSSALWHALQGSMYQCRAEQVVLYYSMWCTNAALCHAKYAQTLYSNVDQVAGLQRHCDVEVWECSRHNPVLSMYWSVHTSMYKYVLDRYLYLSTYSVHTSMYMYVLGMYLYPGHSFGHSCTEYILVCYKKISNIGRQNMKIPPNNGQGDVLAGQKIIVTLPSNALIDLSTFTMDFKGYVLWSYKYVLWSYKYVLGMY